MYCLAPETYSEDTSASLSVIPIEVISTLFCVTEQFLRRDFYGALIMLASKGLKKKASDTDSA